MTGLHFFYFTALAVVAVNSSDTQKAFLEQKISEQGHPHKSSIRARSNIQFESEDVARVLDRKGLGRQDSHLGDSITCTLCEDGIRLVRGLIKNKRSRKVVIDAAINFCRIFRIEDETVCKMIIHEYQEEILYVAEKLSMEPAQACGILLSKECGGHYYPGEMWNISFPTVPKPAPKPPRPPKPDAPKLRVLHLTDIHVDFQYTEGAKVHCGEPLCCRNTKQMNAQGSGKFHDEKAGRWGHYGQCDIPSMLLTNLFKHLSHRSNDFDFIIFTGDVPAHDVWNQTQVDQMNSIVFLNNLFKQYFPRKPVYWTIGNHEAAPCNSFPPPGIHGHSMDWLYDQLSKLWSKWLPKSSLPDVKRCGAFSVSPYHGFRIISFNSNYCNSKNPWLLLNATDPCGTLQWLVEELQKAENNKEKVHILTHIPPGIPACLKPWSYNYYKIVNRYENTIVNQFFGHDHEDWFQMFYDEETFQRPLGFGFVAPAITPKAENNPTYRIYTIDGNYAGSSWAVLNYTNYYFNLTEANEGTPEWQYAYSPVEAYNMSSLYAADWERLLQRMETDDALLQKFHVNYYNLHDQGRCDEGCKKQLLCQIKEGRSYDLDLCRIHK